MNSSPPHASAVPVQPHAGDGVPPHRRRTRRRGKAGRRAAFSLIVLLALAAYVYASVHTMKASASPMHSEITAASSGATGGVVSDADRISVVIWNLGYGGLGQDSDFFADGGKGYLPPSRRAVRDSVAAIASWLDASDADVVMTQENATASAVNLWVDLKRATDAALNDYAKVFYPDFQTRLLPPPLRIRNGQATYVRTGLRDSELWPLPGDGDPYAGALRRRYAALVTRVDGPGGCWTFVNVHTSAFDEGAALRRRQIQALLARAEQERSAGRRVVLGGDFNLRLVPTAFPHTTAEKFLFWVHDFPRDLLPPGWRLAADGSVPTVRTNERPYRAGQNYTTVIDGYILSPEVELASVQGVDLGFRHSDHQPVHAVFRPAPGGSGTAATCGRTGDAQGAG